MDWQKAYRNEILLTTIWVVFILFVDINPLVYWKGIMNVKIFAFPGQYGFYLLNLVFIIPVASFIGAYLGNKIELQITGEVEREVAGAVEREVAGAVELQVTGEVELQVIGEKKKI